MLNKTFSLKIVLLFKIINTFAKQNQTITNANKLNN